MNTPPSPEGQPGSGAESEPSPTRKRSHSAMAAGQQGAQRASHIVEISSTGPDSNKGDSNEQSSPPPGEYARPEEQLDLDTQSQKDKEMDPELPLEDFDWRELEVRFHEAMDKQNIDHRQLSGEFGRLLDFFHLWAETTPNYEGDRTFYRLRTRMAHVQNSENELEKKREHYTRVVDAFESALRLLEG